jgi:ubiquinone/menaquinone biosynthesis C-methylase UbiE
MAGNEARFWDRMARKYAASPISDMEGYERTLERARHYLKPEFNAFEFGCGTGTTALKLAPSVAKLVATDVSGAMIDIGREKATSQGVANVEFAVGTPDSVSYPSASFDAVMAFNLLHLVENRDVAYRGVHRLLKQGGLFITKTPCLKEMNPIFRPLVPIMRAFGQAPYVAFFNAAELEEEIATAGFEIIERARHASRGKDARPFIVARKL